eukprot:1195641-Prorocentrum_minimum.AAC.2
MPHEGANQVFLGIVPPKGCPSRSTDTHILYTRLFETILDLGTNGPTSSLRDIATLASYLGPLSTL